MMKYAYLVGAIVSEVVATSSLKSSEQFTRLIPSLLVIAGYGSSFYCLSMILDAIPLGIAYAVWSSLGIVLVSIVGIVLFKQVPDLPAVIGMAMIVGGVVVIHAFSRTVGH
jgi:small multidrug resistance pump